MKLLRADHDEIILKLSHFMRSPAFGILMMLLRPEFFIFPFYRPDPFLKIEKKK